MFLTRANKIVLPQGSDNRSGPEAGEENAVAQSAPTGSAPTPPPDDTLVASVDVDVPVGGGEEAPFHFPRPKIHIGRNLDPPGDDDDGDDDGNDDEDTDDDDDADTGCTDDEGLPAEDPTAEEPAEEPEAEAEPEVEEGPVADEEPVHEEQPAPDEDVESVHDEAGELDESVADEPVEDFEGSGEED